jgi:hypothetical protein
MFSPETCPERGRRIYFGVFFCLAPGPARHEQGRRKRGNLKKYLALEVLDFADYLFRRFTPGCPQEDCLFFSQILNSFFLLNARELGDISFRKISPLKFIRHLSGGKGRF